MSFSLGIHPCIFLGSYFHRSRDLEPSEYGCVIPWTSSQLITGHYIDKQLPFTPMDKEWMQHAPWLECERKMYASTGTTCELCTGELDPRFESTPVDCETDTLSVIPQCCLEFFPIILLHFAAKCVIWIISWSLLWHSSFSHYISSHTLGLFFPNIWSYKPFNGSKKYIWTRCLSKNVTLKMC